MRARAVMVLGTASHVGKSLMTAALCRIAAQQGWRVAPFKAQNMSLNSAATVEGLEIGRAQALQAEAAGVPASVHMNPILLKPAGDMSSQVVVRGRIWGRVSASDYHLRRVEELMPAVRESYEALAAQNDVVFLEGAGSPAEINLKRHDIANMRAAEMADAACLLVGDIDRGGVFAALLGTFALLEKPEQARIRGFMINKFRGDVSLLEPGLRMMEDRLERPCLGVLPYRQGLSLDEEDSLGLPAISGPGGAGWPGSAAAQAGDRALRIAVVALPSFSNFTDFDALAAEPSVALRFCRTPESLQQADLVIVPGSKQTADDLLWMRREGLAQALLDHARTGLIVGICGGMQMLGEEILDPDGVERAGRLPGLGLLPIRTVMRRRKVTRLASGRLASRSLFGCAAPETAVGGYEIHVGETQYGPMASPFAYLRDCTAEPANGEAPAADATGESSHSDGCVSADGRIFGTYLHGLFDEDGFRGRFLASARDFHGLGPAPAAAPWRKKREDSLNALAAAVSASLDIGRIFGWAGLPYPRPGSQP